MQPSKYPPFYRDLCESLSIRSWTAPAVVVKVGQPVKVFHVNEQLLCASSDYVKTALKPQWLEGGRRIITLP